MELQDCQSGTSRMTKLLNSYVDATAKCQVSSNTPSPYFILN